MCVLKTGFLFCASEFGNQYVHLALTRFFQYSLSILFIMHTCSVCVNQIHWDTLLHIFFLKYSSLMSYCLSLVLCTRLPIWEMMMGSQSSRQPCPWKKEKHSSLPPGLSRTLSRCCILFLYIFCWWLSISFTAFCVFISISYTFQVDKLESLSPVMSCLVADLAAEDTPQLYIACGRGPQSSLRVLRHGLEVNFM